MAEFDEYADGYKAGMEDPIKRAIGDSHERFLRIKLDQIHSDLGESDLEKPLTYLDFGCGEGAFLSLVSEAHAQWDINGYDISEKMLKQARHRYPELSSCRWHHDVDSLEEGSFDVVTAICVFHHIPPALWQESMNKIYRLLKPGGSFYIFEHNPFNPLTLLIVKRAEIDRNAVLLSPGKSSGLARRTGFRNVITRFFLFTPPNWSISPRLDQYLTSLPLGGQYMVRAKKA